MVTNTKSLAALDKAAKLAAAEQMRLTNAGYPAPATKTKRPSRAKKSVIETATELNKAILDAQAMLPSKAQQDAEYAAAQAEEAANLAKEAADLEAERLEIAAAAAKQAEEDAKGGYRGPMLALRDRVKAKAYHKAPNGQPMCGDELAISLGGLEPRYVIMACIAALDLPKNPYEHLNIGQQSMNLRNKLRGALKRGEFGMGVVNEAIEDATILQEQDIEAEEARIRAERQHQRELKAEKAAGSTDGNESPNE